MNLTLRRVIEYPVILVRTLNYSQLNSYLVFLAILVLSVPFALSIGGESPKASKSLYSVSMVNSPAVAESNRVIKLEQAESQFSEETRIEKERQIALAKRAVIAREATQVRYTTPVNTPDPGDDAKRLLVKDAASDAGIPWQLLEAVWQVESGKSWDMARKSYAGAQGPMQFIPSTWRAYAVDGDNNGTADINSASDSVHGGARLLAANGANRGDFYRALFAYNHADWYVKKVLTIARSIGLE